MKSLLIFILITGDICAQSHLQTYVAEVYKIENVESVIITSIKEFRPFINQHLDCTEIDNKIDSTFTFGGLLSTFRFKKNIVIIRNKQKGKTKGTWYFSNNQLVIKTDQTIQFKVTRLNEHLILESDLMYIHLSPAKK